MHPVLTPDTPVPDATGAPVVDLADLATDDPSRLDRAAAALHAGYGTLGLVTITGHTLDRAEVDALYQTFEAVCALPEDTKRRYHRDDLWFQRGWTPPNTERAVVAGGQPDFKECWFAAPRPTDPEARLGWPELYADNVWPEGHDAFRTHLVGVGVALHDVGRLLLTGCERALGLDTGIFSALLDGAAHVTRVLRYLPLDAQQTQADVLWGEEHTDFNLLTLLAGGRFLDPQGRPTPAPDDRAGLYLRTRPSADHPRGRMVKGRPPAGHLVSQVGQQLEILTGGAFQATPHVIKAPASPGYTRASVAHFLHVHAERVLAPIGPFRTPELLETWRPPVLAGTYGVKTLVDIGLAPPSALDRLGYRAYDRLAAIRADGEW